MNKKIEIKQTDINSADGAMLISELNAVLTKITGDDGTRHFASADVEQSRSAFLVCYVDNQPFGCGALRERDAKIGEIKRVYSRKNSLGVGHRIMSALEERARELGYEVILLETRVQNARAIAFYNDCGYAHCENYGAYIGNENSYCFKKVL